MYNEVFSLEWKSYCLKGYGSVKGNRDLTGVVSLVAALERSEEEKESKCG